MSKISQIEAELKTMEQGIFQKLCNAFLYMKFGIPPKSEGSAKGVDKTKTGTPDSFLVLPTDNFAFIEYTTQQTGLGKKFLDDLEKNFDEEKTGVPLHKIEKVLLCYNSQLSPKETNKIIEFCSSYNTNVEFIDLDLLKFELYYYPKLAKDFLNVEPDTEQILRPDDFIKELENKGTSQTNKFFAREEELSELSDALKANNIIVIAGKAGTGKTRIAREAVKQFIDTNDEHEPFCILTKGQPLYNDLKSYFLSGRKYIIIVDDANRIGHFPSIARLTNSEKFEIKIIVTVRDYAFEKVKKQLEAESHVYTTIELKPLEDETVREILKSMQVTSPLCVNNITRIADGNPRLVIMSAEHALIDNDCTKLQDVTDIYDKFFEPLIAKGELKDKALLSVLGIVCFFRVIDRSHDKIIQRIYNSFEIHENDFWESIFKLHDLEFVNLYEKRVVKIADQVLANYFFYLVFIKKEVLDFSIILNDYLTDFKGKIKDSLYPILNHFNHEIILKIISPKLDKRLLQIKENEDELINFFDVFGFYQQEHILIFIKNKIDQLPDPRPGQYQFRQEKNNDWWATDKNYPLLKLLKMFGQHPNDHFETSLELLFNYVQKSREILPDVVRYLEGELLFDEDDYRYWFWIQTTLFEFLFKKIEEGNDNTLFVGILFEIAPKFLKTHFQKSKGGRKRHSITMYHVTISKTPVIEQFRKDIFEKIFSLYSECSEKVLLFFENYCSSWDYYPQEELYKHDAQYIIPFIQENLLPANFRHCQIVQSYFIFLDRLEFNHNKKKELLEKFRNPKFNLHEILTFNYSDWYREEGKSGTKEFSDYNKKRLAQHFSNYKLEDYFQLVEEVEDLININAQENTHDISLSLETILTIVLEKSPQDCWAIVKHLFKIGNPYKFDSYKIVNDLLEHFPTDKIYSTINNHEFGKKQQWLFHFFASLKPEQVTTFYKDELLTLYSSLNERHYLFFSFLENYKSIEPNIFCEVLKILLYNVEEENFNLGFFAPDLFTKYFEEFEDDFTLFKRLYFHCYFRQSASFDRKGEYFKKLYKLDNSFLLDFIKKILENKYMFTRNELKFNFHFIWEYDNAEEIIINIIDYTIEKKIYSGGDHIASKFFPPKDLSQRIDIFFNNYIEEHATDKERMQAICSVIRNCYSKQRIPYLQKLLKHNSNLEFWYYLPIARGSSIGPVSSFIPIYERQIEFWEELVPIFSGKVEYLKHRQWAQSKIKSLKNEIEREIEREFIEDY